MLIVTRTHSGDKFRKCSEGSEIVLVDYTYRPGGYAEAPDADVKVSCYRASSRTNAQKALNRACEILGKPQPDPARMHTFEYAPRGPHYDFEYPEKTRHSWESGHCLYFYA